MSKLLLAVALLALQTSCSRKTEVETAPPPGLKRVVETLYAKQPCAAVIPEHWSPSWPVPTGAKRGGEFKLLYYPVARKGRGLELSAPLGEAVFASADGSVTSCERLPGADRRLPGRHISEKASRYSPDELRRRSDRLYALSEAAAELFSRGGPPAPEDKSVLREYGLLFLDLAEPPLLPYYYSLQPEFWDWLRASGAPSLTSPGR